MAPRGVIQELVAVVAVGGRLLTAWVAPGETGGEALLLSTTEASVAYTRLDDFYWRVAARGRLLSLAEGGHLIGLCVYFVGWGEADVQRFYHRPMLSVPEDDASGTLIYLDHLMTYQFTRGLWHLIEQQVTQQVPQWTQAVWYRPGRGSLPDRRYNYYRRRR